MPSATLGKRGSGGDAVKSAVVVVVVAVVAVAVAFHICNEPSESGWMEIKTHPDGTDLIAQTHT